jgi:tRNA A37 N6-isopentenylltransferase MiaA
MTTKSKALQSLRSGAQWVLRGDDLEWLDTEQTQPTDAEITAEVARLQAEYEAKEYQRKRAAEYPPMADYLDGVVKGNQAQIDAYVAACLTVKAKYPKEQA